ncbi:MAG: response regulator, partial [Candidatus Omnitrophica bacterium]|nr:response regulator [Candidatus Omnitrophota bacterium]
MDQPNINVLLIEDEAVDVKLIRRALKGRSDPQFRITSAETLQTGIAAANDAPVDIALLDLNLIDSNGLSTLERFRQAHPLIPLVVLTGLNDRDFGVQALLAGAQDYLIKGQIDAELLSRVLVYSIERCRIKNRLIEDELKIRLFVKHSPVALAMFDRNMRYLMTSQRWLDDYGFTEDQIIGEFHYDVLTGISEKWKTLHHRCLAGESLRSDEDLLVFAGGRKEWIRWEMHPWRNSDDIVSGLIIFREVITARKLVEEELVRYKNELEKRVDERTGELRSLYAHLEDVRELERKTIAREVHDELGQALTALNMDVAWLNRHLNTENEGLSTKLKTMSNLISDTIKTVQRICSQLRPGILDDLGLVAALEWLSEDFENRSEISCQIQVEFDDQDLEDKYATTIFRVYQETLTNILRHANASQIRVQLTTSGQEIRFEVRDNGTGIAPEALTRADAFGLIGMRERVGAVNGELAITGAPNQGTTVTVRLPLEKKEKRYAEDSH